MIFFRIYYILFILLFTTPLCWSNLTEEEGIQQQRALECPEAEDILPCVCHIWNPEYMEMECSDVLDEFQLAQVFQAYFPVTNFNSFSMTSNHALKVLPDFVFGDVTFDEVHLWFCDVQEVQENAFAASFDTLTYMDFYDCDISIFPFHVLDQFTVLYNLNLDNNNLQEFPVFSSSSLRMLYLQNNPLGSVPLDAFANAPALYSIFLYNTQLDEILPGTFSRLMNLTVVTVYNNRLDEVPEGFIEFNGVNGTVDLGANNISSVAIDAFTGLTGGKIKIHYNNLEELEEPVWRPLLEIGVELHPYGNPLVCGCDIAWLIQDPNLLAQVDTYLTNCEDATPLNSSLTPLILLNVRATTEGACSLAGSHKTNSSSAALNI